MTNSTLQHNPKHSEIGTAIMSGVGVEDKGRLRSHKLMHVIAFFFICAWSITQSGAWPYLNEIDGDATPITYGFVVASNPVTAMIFSPLLGHWSNKLHSFRWPLIVATLCLVIGNVLYAFLYIFEGMGSIGFYAMMVTRLLTGLSAAIMSLSKTYLVASTTPSERSSAVTVNVVCQTMGWVVGPGLQAIVGTWMNTRIDTPVPGLVFNEYTVVAWMAVAIGCCSLVALSPFCFKEYIINTEKSNVSHVHQEKLEKNNSPKPNYIGVIVTLLLFGICSFFTMVRETLGTPMVEDFYGLSPSKAAAYVSITVAVGNLLSVGFMLLTLKPFKRMDTRNVLLWWGTFLMCVGISLHYPFSDEHVVVANCTNTARMPHQTYGRSFQIPRLTTTKKYQSLASTNDAITILRDTQEETCYGCPVDLQPWCEDAKLITGPQMIVTYCVARIGINNVVSTIPTVYSKIFGPIPMGVWMSLLSVISAIFRLFGPMLISYIYEVHGPVILYTGLLGLQSAALIMGLVFFKTMAPMKETSGDPRHFEDLPATGYENRSRSKTL